MNTLFRLSLCVLMLTSATGRAAEPVDACAALRAENEALKARILELEKGTAPAAAAAPVAAAPVATAPVPPTIPATPAPPPTASEPASKPTKIVRVVEEEPYSRSGCRGGLFKSIPHAIWMEVDRWQDLDKGMSPAEVEKLLGPEHYVSTGGNRIKWEYGKCGSFSDAQLLFQDGRLIDWRAPDQ